jgi:hypothetical protein
MDPPPIFNEVQAPTQISKKRKKPDEEKVKEETRELVAKAKFYCKNIKEWRVVSKYNKSKLETYLADQQYLESAQMVQSFGSFAKDIYGFVLDKLVKGDGYVEAEIKNDITLEQALQRELVEYCKFITNRLQILIFSSINVINGKKKQKQNGPCQQSERNNIYELPDRNTFENVQESGPNTWESDPIEFGPNGNEDEVGEETSF